ncbi:hypothetical protein BDV26DRAFT_229027 [Aspergillus bertholletiae]|uniref:Membrane anchor Opy2 N-terminal domain-containing protein n=1 Tax=Aspergillus bertholletiae TaxID=1226010 RepID=A0A5N7B6E7_9EURO|nr:hypothetical protein BDV26DRAFT_229027 [Aspergillus bertholletiae]
MSFYSTDPSFSSHVLSGRSIFKRCVSCDSTAPTCPTCSSGEICTMISQSCDQCATTKCIKTSSGSSSQDSSSGGSNAGAIAGGVVGGIAAVAIVTFLVWWFFIRKKRQEQAERQATSDGEKSSTLTDARQSRKSTNSIASTVLTRASNVIQIAYIPGVTNRSPPETPLVPPVPPLPGAAPDQHFFMPGDLRDSAWSEASRQHLSIAPSLRSSVATTIYRDNAIVSPMPAQQVMRTRAAVVSIHNGGNPPGSGNTLAPPDAPAVPAITQAQLARAGISESHTSSSIVARTVTAKPVMVKGSIKKKNKGTNNSNTTTPTSTPSAPSPAVQTIQEQSESSTSSASSTKPPSGPTSGFDDHSSDEEGASAKHIQPKKGGSPAPKSPTVIEDSPAVDQSPFQDQLNTQANRRASARLSSRLEADEGTGSNRSSRIPLERTESPFSDANEVK